MKAGKPRTLRDVDEQTRAAVIKAAQKSGLSVEEWLGTPAGQALDLSVTTPSPREAAPYRPAGPSPPYAPPPPGEDPSLELREAIARLTARLGVMDENARASVAGLALRLAEIENRLSFLVDTRQPADQRSRAMAEASAMIGVLVRDIDAAALRASAIGAKAMQRASLPSGSPRLPGAAVTPTNTQG